jgi:hypothetical protein
MDDVSAAIEQALARLAETPRQIALLAGGVERGKLHSRPDEGSWSPNDILAHLRANAEVWGTSITRMMAEDHPTIRYASPRGWMTKSGYTGQEFAASLAAFGAQRAALLVALRRLAMADWARGATFTGTTRGREQTILSYAQRIADHEGQHLLQLEATISALQASRSEQADHEP